MKELKEYLAPELLVIELNEYIFTDSSEQDFTSDPYGSDGDKWWE